MRPVIEDFGIGLYYLIRPAICFGLICAWVWRGIISGVVRKEIVFAMFVTLFLETVAFWLALMLDPL